MYNCFRSSSICPYPLDEFTDPSSTFHHIPTTMPKDATSPIKPNPPSSPYKKPRSPPTKDPPTPYTITFGAQHKGQLLSTCKPDWVKWVIKEQVYDSRADLKAALIDHGYMNEDGTPGRAEPVASPSKPKISAEVAEALEGWVLPRREQTRQFWDVFREQDTWITTKNALEFYKVSLETPASNQSILC